MNLNVCAICKGNIKYVSFWHDGFANVWNLTLHKGESWTLDDNGRIGQMWAIYTDCHYALIIPDNVASEIEADLGFDLHKTVLSTNYFKEKYGNYFKDIVIDKNRCRYYMEHMLHDWNET